MSKKRTAELEGSDQIHGIERHIRIKEAASITGLSEAYFRALCMRRKIRFRKAGTATLIPISEIRRLLDEGQREPIGAV